jgi:type IV secretion system protein VirB10
MDTSTPGYVTCVVPKDVYSDNGSVVLMEKGTRVLGEYHSGMRQGQKRLFVLWDRAVTPSGVAINVASPASDSLGRAGFDGDIDTHFWARFGGALMLSIVDDGIAAAAGGNNRYPNVVQLPSDAAGIALQNSINIPPTLRKPQGAEVSIFVAQDLNFAGVYGLKPR